jgi:hypothetical protein
MQIYLISITTSYTALNSQQLMATHVSVYENRKINGIAFSFIYF